MELASNQDLKIGESKEGVLARGNRVHARRQVCQSDGKWRAPAGHEAVCMGQGTGVLICHDGLDLDFVSNGQNGMV